MDFLCSNAVNSDYDADYCVFKKSGSIYDCFTTVLIQTILPVDDYYHVIYICCIMNVCHRQTYL